MKKGRMSDQLHDQWRTVIAKSDIHDLGNTQIDYWIGKILSGDSELGRDWLITQMKREDESISYSVMKIAEKAIPALSNEQRIDVLRHDGRELALKM